MIDTYESQQTPEVRDVREAPPEKTKPIIARLVALLAQNDNDDLDSGEMVLPSRRSIPSFFTAAHGKDAVASSAERPGSERIRLYWTSSASGKAALVWTSSRPDEADESSTFEFDARKGTIDFAMHSLLGEPAGGRAFLTLEDLERVTTLAEANLITKKRLGELRKDAEVTQDAAVRELFRSYLGDRMDGEWTFRDEKSGVTYRLNAGEDDKIHVIFQSQSGEGRWRIDNATVDKATGRFLYGQSFDQDDVIIGTMDRKAFIGLLRGMRQILGSVGYTRV